MTRSSKTDLPTSAGPSPTLVHGSRLGDERCRSSRSSTCAGTPVRRRGSTPRSTTRSTGSTRALLTFGWMATATRRSTSSRVRCCGSSRTRTIGSLSKATRGRYLSDAEDGHGARRPRSGSTASTTRRRQRSCRPPHERPCRTRSSPSCTSQVTAQGFDIEVAGSGLYDLMSTVRAKTGARPGQPCRALDGRPGGPLHDPEVCASSDGNAAARQATSSRSSSPTGRRTAASPSSVGAWTGLQEAFGPAGADIFAPEKMYGYLTPGATFGDEPRRRRDWDPQRIDPGRLPRRGHLLPGRHRPPGLRSRPSVVVGPKSDGLVRIEHAYVRGANRAYVYKSHSGAYGEVNSEEGYQNLRRFLFGRWAVQCRLRSPAARLRPRTGRDVAGRHAARRSAACPSS